MRAAANLAPIEPGIRPVCDALNRVAGVQTIWSCEGHPWRDAPPFVVFNAHQAAAFRVHKLLGHGHGDGSLKYCWWLTSRFNEDGSLQYVLESNDCRVVPRSRLFPKWRRAGMDQDLSRLALLLSQMSN